MDIIRLSPRLQAAADLVRPGAVLADIGTDHAYLPAYLLQTGRIFRAYGADIHAGPLSKARETAERYGLAHRIELILSDGLKQVPASQVDDVVIAGMGGDLICRIIEDCEQLKQPQKHLILQPMTHPEAVRCFLYRKGFELLCETAVLDGKFAYVVMLAEYSGKPREISPLFARFGRLTENRDEASRTYLRRQYQKMKTICRSLEASPGARQKYEAFSRLLAQLDTVLEQEETP